MISNYEQGLKIARDREKLERLVSCNPEMQRFLSDIEIFQVDEKCAIFRTEALPKGENLKYVVDNSTGTPGILNYNLQQIVFRGLRAQLSLQGLEGVQVLRREGFYENIIGLLGPFEYLPGCNLSKINDPELQDPERVLTLFQALDKNLKAIHNRNIIHGDIKPGNLVYNKERLVIIDWSTARTFLEDFYTIFEPTILCTQRYFYPARNRSLDYWALSLTMADVLLKERIQLTSNTPNETIQKLQRELQRFGQQFTEFYTDLANRPFEHEADKVCQIQPKIFCPWSDTSPLTTFAMKFS